MPIVALEIWLRLVDFNNILYDLFFKGHGIGHFVYSRRLVKIWYFSYKYPFRDTDNAQHMISLNQNQYRIQLTLLLRFIDKSSYTYRLVDV